MGKLLSVLALVALFASSARAQNPPQPGFYFDTQFLWFESPVRDEFTPPFRPRDESGFVELAPRFIIGYDNDFGARVRWWTVDREATIFSVAVLPYHKTYQLDVIDLEATTHLQHGSSDFLFSGGARIAELEWHQVFEVDPPGSVADPTEHEEASFGGVTLAGEGRTGIYSTESWATSFIYGGRLSLLDADWTGSSGFAPPFFPGGGNTRYIVPEVFTGIEARYGRAFTRLSFEMQDWRGNVPASVRHSFDFTGLGFDLGFSF
jgi:hypothetical protein